MRASKMPPPGVALTHQDVRVLTVEPGVSWKREDMARSYEKLGERIGFPLAVVMDGAVELREGAVVLQKHEKTPSFWVISSIMRQRAEENYRWITCVCAIHVEVGFTRSPSSKPN